MTSKPIITIDGPLGSGRKTLANSLVNTYGFVQLNLNIVLRRLADTLRRAQVQLDDVDGVLEHASDMTEPELLGTRLHPTMKSRDMFGASLKLMMFPGLPEVLNAKFNTLAADYPCTGLVAVGTSMGRNVFPDAGLKIFLDGAYAERAARIGRDFKGDLIVRDLMEQADYNVMHRLPDAGWKLYPIGRAFNELKLIKPEQIDAAMAYPQVFIPTTNLGESGKDVLSADKVALLGKALVGAYLPEVKTIAQLRREKPAVVVALPPAAA